MRSAPFLLAAALTLTAAPAFAQSIDEMAGQMIVVGFQGSTVAATAALREEIAKGELGGVMYLGSNISDLKTVKAMNEAFLAANPSLPPFITVDQEGGNVQRLNSGNGFFNTPSARDVAKKNNPDKAFDVYKKMADGLAGLGFNVNFGPVADVDINPSNPVIGRYGRAYSADPTKVMEYDSNFISAHSTAGIITALKHFPGHGSSTEDSHEGFVDISGTWSDKELMPYKMLVSNPDVMVMMGHLYVGDHGDGAGVPASLSSYWITDVLRGQLGFKGVVITDDMEMGAVLDHYPLEDRIVRAVNAGVDILLFSNTARPRASIADDIREILVRHAEADPAFRAHIEESYARIVALKARIVHQAGQ